MITGGPGVGKTTFVNTILLVLRTKKIQCLPCAPPGRPAKRFGETASIEAKTIHRLLEFQQSGGFSRSRQFVVLVGQKKALATAIRNDRAAERYSALYACLSQKSPAVSQPIP